MLLAGLYPPSEGQVRFDGLNLATLDLPSARRQVGAVLQDPLLLTTNIAENIALRRPDASMDDVTDTATLAAIHDDIARLPLGYATTLANRGAEFSGGQRQRMALARALLDRPNMLVLDEATSHLDGPTEAAIERNLRELNITRIVVAHRLSTIHDADQIIVLDQGRVVEAGTTPNCSATPRCTPAPRSRFQVQPHEPPAPTTQSRPEGLDSSPQTLGLANRLRRTAGSSVPRAAVAPAPEPPPMPKRIHPEPAALFPARHADVVGEEGLPVVAETIPSMKFDQAPSSGLSVPGRRAPSSAPTRSCSSAPCSCTCTTSSPCSPTKAPV